MDCPVTFFPQHTLYDNVKKEPDRSSPGKLDHGCPMTTNMEILHDYRGLLKQGISKV
jgi:hypothetical protein